MKTYNGIHIPLITPFKNGSIDYNALDKLIEYYCQFNIASISPCGSTGESCTLSHDEQKSIISYVVKKVNGRTKVLAGTGSNNTIEAIELTKYAYEVGVDACLIVSPYYNKPSQEGIIDYYLSISKKIPIDIILYNIPSRTSSLLSVETIKTLSNEKNIKGIKEGYGDLGRFQDLTGHFIDSDFSILTGEDTMLFECLALGGDGGIMAAAGLVTEELIQLKKLMDNSNLIDARNKHHYLLPLINKLFDDTNPILVKYAIAKLLNLPYELRSPLTLAKNEKLLEIDAFLENYNLI